MTKAKMPPKMSSKKRTRAHRKPTAWQTSATWRRIGSEAIRAFNARKHLLPKCGAHAKSTGEPCKNLALDNGRCRVHGGRTPKGDQHGVRQFTAKPSSRQTKRDWPRVQAKLDRFSKQDRDRQRRLALMTDAEFRSYFKSTHAKHGWEFRKIVDAELRRRGLTRTDILPTVFQPMFDTTETARPLDPEVVRLENEITRLKALKAEIEMAEAAGDRVAVDELDAAFVTEMFGGSTQPAPAPPTQTGDQPAAEQKPGYFGVFA